MHAELRTFCAVHINNIYIYIIVITVSSTLFLSNKWATSSKMILNKIKSKMAACFRSSVKICNDRYFFYETKWRTMSQRLLCSIQESHYIGKILSFLPESLISNCHPNFIWNFFPFIEKYSKDTIFKLVVTTIKFSICNAVPVYILTWINILVQFYFLFK